MYNYLLIDAPSKNEHVNSPVRTTSGDTRHKVNKIYFRDQTTQIPQSNRNKRSVIPAGLSPWTRLSWCWGKQLNKYQGSSGLCVSVLWGSEVAVEAHLRWTCVKDEGSWMGWMGFLRESGETLWTAVGSSWFLLMICRASWVFPENTTNITWVYPSLIQHTLSYSNSVLEVTDYFSVQHTFQNVFFFI